MEKVFGPIDGYYAAIFARELDGKFRASYKVCAIAPADYRSACPLRHRRVDGLSHTLAEAMEIAEQLARLQIARLCDQRQGRHTQRSPQLRPRDFDSSLGDDSSASGTGGMYAPTEPSPLYAATEPCPLYARID
jgi:hypothetical protein